jgi:carbon-monoxide dehydrogenase small subunit
VSFVSEPAEALELELTVNGRQVQRRVPARTLLADLLRQELGLTGTHVGCEHGICGACTVLVDGQPARSCIVLAVQVDGAAVTTVEGLAPNGQPTRMQEAFKACHGLQCGFCTPGLLITLDAADPEDYTGDRSLRELLSGHLCRCTGYEGILAAVRAAWGPSNGVERATHDA